MPKYEYKCSTCGHVDEIEGRFADPYKCAKERVKGASMKPCGGTKHRVYSFGVGKVKGAGDSPGRTS